MQDFDKYRLFFSCLKLYGGKVMEKLLAEYGTEEEIYKLDSNIIKKTSLLTDKQKEEFFQAKQHLDIERFREEMLERGICLTTMTMEDYPLKLRHIDNRPYNLFYVGRLPDNDRRSVAIIGARNCSEYGKNMAEYFGREMARAGVQVISGMASGIDGMAQMSAIANGGYSAGILGCGVDICYPRSNYCLYKELIGKGCLISEYAPSEKPLAKNFPIRNRIISGLADLLLVIEAREKSGTAITVEMALEQGKDVFAVPGRNCDSLSYGCNKLIYDGAGIAISANCILEALGIDDKADEGISVERKLANAILSCDNERQRNICKVIAAGNNSPTKILEALGDEEPEYVLATLVELMVKGALTSKGSLYYLN